MFKIKGVVAGQQIDVEVECDADKVAELMLGLIRAFMKIRPESLAELSK